MEGELTIREQLKAHCDCLPEMDDHLFNKVLKRAISHISSVTCWRNEFCATFLNEKRTELVNIGAILICGCDAGLVKLNPWFSGRKGDLIDPETFEVEIIRVQGLSEETNVLPLHDFAYITSKNELRMNLLNFVDVTDCCPTELQAKITYYAGYDQIPDCLLDLFCDLMRVIHDITKCDCSTCQKCTSEDLQATEVDDITEPTIDNFINTIITTGYRKNLGLMSNCKKVNGKPWGAKV